MPFPDRITTERLVLHRWDAGAHTRPLTAVNAHPEAVRFLNAGVPYTPEESARQSSRFAEHWAIHAFGLWAIEADHGIVGFAGVCHPGWFPEYEHELEIAWRLDPSAWGRGYATEAAQAALDAAFLHLDVSRVIAFIDPGNDASTAVARRLGFTLRELATSPDGPIELWERRRTDA